ncbi:hypothetical protein MLPM_0939 [Mycobacterium lepromatosis]|uniref:Uncharacterized protein n=1 Tax=Mycobacterium lepromatosis TaxID=480418 RepID=A0A0F4EUU2_9MYCO|nr:hypothetical protein MLPM_0939 [Mycobacterium lepromatosis]
MIGCVVCVGSQYTAAPRGASKNWSQPNHAGGRSDTLVVHWGPWRYGTIN